MEISQRNLNDCNSRQWELQICIIILANFGVRKDVTFGFSLFSFFRKAVFWLQDRWIHWRARQVWSVQLMPVNKICVLGLAKTCPVLLKNLNMYLPVSLSKMYGEIFSEVFFFFFWQVLLLWLQWTESTFYKQVFQCPAALCPALC